MNQHGGAFTQDELTMVVFCFSVIELILKKHPSQRQAKDRKYGATPLHWAKTKDVGNLSM